MAKIGNPTDPPRMPWGSEAWVRERLVDPGQVLRAKLLRKQADRKKGPKGDSKTPPLATHALLEFLGSGHTSDELRLPAPTMPRGHEADLEGFIGKSHLQSALTRMNEDLRGALDRSLGGNLPPDRAKRCKTLLDWESGMHRELKAHFERLSEVIQKLKDENEARY